MRTSDYLKKQRVIKKDNGNIIDKRIEKQLKSELLEKLKILDEVDSVCLEFKSNHIPYIENIVNEDELSFCVHTRLDEGLYRFTNRSISL